MHRTSASLVVRLDAVMKDVEGQLGSNSIECKKIVTNETPPLTRYYTRFNEDGTHLRWRAT